MTAKNKRRPRPCAVKRGDYIGPVGLGGDDTYLIYATVAQEASSSCRNGTLIAGRILTRGRNQLPGDVDRLFEVARLFGFHRGWLI